MLWLQVYSLSVKLVAALSKAINIEHLTNIAGPTLKSPPSPLPYPPASFCAQLNIINCKRISELWLSYKSPSLLGPDNGCEGDWK